MEAPITTVTAPGESAHTHKLQIGHTLYTAENLPDLILLVLQNETPEDLNPNMELTLS